jgi:hypothetical protein
VTDSTYLEPLLDVIRDLVAWMKDQNVPGAVIGGVAAGRSNTNSQAICRDLILKRTVI